MTISSRVLARLCNLSRPETRDVVIVRDLAIPMPDGVVLCADRY